ncbi:HlyD family secretion protein [Geomesophilobacter sediminis]|uniref:HlyD family efflux transporter periplasmic adaptor subunit n=1 Tax=Geomesophilobacter sediminis TaxID=2798584 RepID=A0A8J7JDS3_9BACT|nr:HlyD family efflux transporter periplasmic adaptor subunit [Geomesophilobacter sediminis]MBJ6725466.1 HlyD family efflux transporter periplasmic adaptor subunit [Geomesophilobacter sediminis]
MTTQRRKAVIAVAAVIVIGIAGTIAWEKYAGRGDGNGLVSGNGRIEATEIEVAAKSPGRVREIVAKEGDFVAAGQIVASMDTETMEAHLRQAQAQLRLARQAVATAESQLAQRVSEKRAVLALVRQREAEQVNARQHAARSAALAEKGAMTRQAADDDATRVAGVAAAVSAARAQVAAAEASVTTAKSQIAGAKAEVEAAQAVVAGIEADLRDSSLKAPRSGRVQYRVAQPGEVVGAGGRVLSLVDLTDVYMTFFLPTSAAGRVPLGSEVRLILDAAPGYVIPAQVSFVADVAQFTPKTVETASEREKLMFRVRAHIPADLLQKHITRVKTGLPGVAYVKLDPAVPWPARLQVRIPQ